MTDQQGADRTKFEALWAEHYQLLFDYARRRLEDEDAARDAVAEAFSAAWLHRRGFPSGGAAKAQLLRSTFHAVSGHQRAERRSRGLRGRLARERTDTPSVFPDSLTTAQQRLAAAISALPMQDQELLRLANWEKLEQSEIAIIMDMTVGNVAVRLHRVRAKLKLLLEADAATSQTSRKGGKRASS